MLVRTLVAAGLHFMVVTDQSCIKHLDLRENKLQALLPGVHAALVYKH
jgi:hypothetical protein